MWTTFLQTAATDMLCDSALANQKLLLKEDAKDMNAHFDPQPRIKHFKDTALSLKPVTDKIGYGKRDRH